MRRDDCSPARWRARWVDAHLRDVALPGTWSNDRYVENKAPSRSFCEDRKVNVKAIV
jgi:hypothetical protein